MQLALGETRPMAEQAGHRVAPAGRVFQALAQHHVAAALAMDRAGLGKMLETTGEIARVREGLRVQLRITARQPAAIGFRGRRFIGKRRERQNLCTSFAPGVDRMRIDETEGLVARERDALAGGWQCRRSVNGRAGTKNARVADNGVEIDTALGGVSKTLDQRREIGMLPGLDEAEMPLR